MPWWESLGVQPAAWWHLIPLAAMACMLLIKLQRPTAALIGGAVCLAADLSFGFNIGLVICLTDLIYNHGIRAPAARVRVANALLTVLALGLTIVTAVVGTGEMAITMLLLSTAVLLVPCWWAAEVRRGYPAFVEDQIRQRLDQERHAELLAEQARRRAAAVEEERRRMARELHDVVSAQVSAVAITSGAVLNSEPDTARDRQALQTIRATSLTALEELRQMVLMLRSPSAENDDDAATELLTETTWNTVLEQAQRHGLGVTVEGAPPEDVSAAVRTVLLRILQEALSNAHRHGSGQARVQVRNARDQLQLTVLSPLKEASATDLVTDPESERETAGQSDLGLGSGSGLAIMQERANSIGGRVSAGEDSAGQSRGQRIGQWAVRAELPLRRTADSRRSKE